MVNAYLILVSVLAFKNVPKEEKPGLTKAIELTDEICLVIPDWVGVPGWLWSKSEWFYARVRINARTSASFHVLSLRESPPDIRN